MLQLCPSEPNPHCSLPPLVLDEIPAGKCRRARGREAVAQPKSHAPACSRPRQEHGAAPRCASPRGAAWQGLPPAPPGWMHLSAASGGSERPPRPRLAGSRVSVCARGAARVCVCGRGAPLGKCGRACLDVRVVLGRFVLCVCERESGGGRSVSLGGGRRCMCLGVRGCVADIHCVCVWWGRFLKPLGEGVCARGVLERFTEPLAGCGCVMGEVRVWIWVGALLRIP